MSKQIDIGYLEEIIKLVVGSPEKGNTNVVTVGEVSSLQVGDSRAVTKSSTITVQQYQDLTEQIKQLKDIVLGLKGDSQERVSIDNKLAVTGNAQEKEANIANDGDVTDLREEVSRLSSEVKRLSELVTSYGAAGPQSTVPDAFNMDIIVLKDKIDVLDKHIPRIGKIEKKLAEYTMEFDNFDIINNQIAEYQDQVMELEKEIGEMKSALENFTKESDIDTKGNLEIYKKIEELEEALSNANATTAQLMTGKEEHDECIQNLLEQIEFLKNVKMDREDLEEALADKADQTMVQRKVSHDQFELAYNDLSRGLERAVAKLTNHEVLLRQALDDIQQEIENKMDRLEILPLTDFVNENLARLHANIDELSRTQREFDAAGTKKYLRNVNCISCDSQAYMSATAKSSLPGFKPLPVRRSVGPFLSYKLDSIRKKEMFLPARNICKYETELQPEVNATEFSQKMCENTELGRMNLDKSEDQVSNLQDECHCDEE